MHVHVQQRGSIVIPPISLATRSHTIINTRLTLCVKSYSASLALRLPIAVQLTLHFLPLLFAYLLLGSLITKVKFLRWPPRQRGFHILVRKQESHHQTHGTLYKLKRSKTEAALLRVAVVPNHRSNHLLCWTFVAL